MCCSRNKTIIHLGRITCSTNNNKYYVYHVMITSLVQQFCFTTTFIYGFNTITARRDLWEDLRRWGPDASWLLLGDFNSILSQEDKHNGVPVSTYETSYFRNCCSDLGIADLNSTGSHFTWTNGTIWT